MSEEKKKIEKTDSSKKEIKPVKEKKPSKIKRIKSFFKEILSEVKKVVWPTPKQVINNTTVVLVVIAISAVFIGLVDTLFKWAAGLLS